MRSKTSSFTTQTRRALLAAGIIAMTAGAASAQDALGDGRGLDSSLQQGRTVNPLGRNTNIAAEVAYRNALVTGNVPNGMSFRESVGYNAVFDFRTEFDPISGRAIPLPSNETFDFRRDSLTSSYPSLGLRGIEAIREQAAWSTGNAYNEQLNIPILRRSGGGQSSAMLSIEQQLVQEGYENNFIDPFRLRPRSMRSTTEHAVGTALETRILGQTENEATQRMEFIQSTPLRGVVSESVVTDSMISLFEGKPLGAPNLLTNIDPDGAEDEAFGYDAVVTRMSKLFNDRYAGPEPDPNAANAPATDPNNSINTTADPADETPQRLESAPDALERLRNKLLGLNTADESEEEPEDTGVIETLRDLFRDENSAGEDRINRLAPPNQHNRNLFAENMQRGEALMANSRWFDAEERFSAALRLSPGDPMASIGRLHAQLGAGLYLSAGVNLDRIFRANPELIAARYDSHLLPRRGRLQRIDNRLRLNIRHNTDHAISSALLMAYLGYQFEDRPTIEDAFTALDRMHAERGDEPDVLETTLRQVWLGP